MTYYGDPSPPAKLPIRRITAPYRGYIQLVWAIVIGACAFTFAEVRSEYVPPAAYDQHATGYDFDATPHHGRRYSYLTIDYRFRDANGVEHVGRSQSSNRRSTSTIEYRASDPSVSRVVGTSRDTSGYAALFLLSICIGSLMIACVATGVREDARDGSRPTLLLLILPVAAVILVPAAVLTLVFYY